MIQHIFILFFTFATYQLSAQQLNTPKEFADIMKYSQVKYFADSNVTIQRDLIILENPPFSVTKNKMVHSKKILPLIKKGNKYFKKEQYEKALTYYLKVLDIDKNNTWVLSRIGRIHNDKKQFQNAIDIFNNLLINNHLNFEIAQELSTAYVGIGDTSAALKAITTAHILNRNDTVIENKMSYLYKKFGYDFYKKGNFVFNYELKQIGQDSIKINTYSPLWNSYANCKAVWKYDKNYQKAKANDFTKNLDFVQEKECLLNFLISYETATEADKKALKSEYDLLTKAIDTKQLNAFIQYEIWAVENPILMHEIPFEDFEEVMKYVRTVRGNTQ